MKFSQLRAVVAVAEYGSFSEAALELQLSQSAVSYAIATLEEELGVPLFSRGRHGAVLTPAGEPVVDHARQAMHHLEMMQKVANRQKGLQGGQVRIASFRSVATHILPQAIAKFRSRYPGVSVTLIERLSYQDVEQCLREGRADIGMTYLPTSNEFEAWELLRDEYVALLPATATPRGSQLTWGELVDYPQVFCLPCGRTLQEHLQKLAPQLYITSNLQEDSTIISMVVQELGAAILPRLAVEPIPKAVQMCQLPVPIERVIGTAVLSDTLHVPAVFAFLEMLKDYEMGTATLLSH